ncbi:MAG: hypothetical protein M1150_02305 [Patescibacteria group bacterium]|nr:hypothetical protein [Patescibacteria group bacterium]
MLSWGGVSYLVATIKGEAKPNKVTFFLWSLAPLIAFFAEIKQGVGIHSLMTFMAGFVPLIIFLASFVNKKAEWQIKTFDLTCGAFSLLGLLFWFLTKDGNVAIMFSIFADGLAASPTVTKSFRFPETENVYLYLTASINALITLLAIKTWDFANTAFPVYIFLVSFIIFLLAKFQLGQYFIKKTQ